jgi:hypothetical protein
MGMKLNHGMVFDVEIDGNRSILLGSGRDCVQAGEIKERIHPSRPIIGRLEMVCKIRAKATGNIGTKVAGWSDGCFTSSKKNS